MSEISRIFESLPGMFQKGAMKVPRTFYFSLDEDEKWTVTLDRERCQVTPRKQGKDADRFFKASKQMFMDGWNGKHTPSAKDFLTGAIKSNNPLLLKDFVSAFKKA